MRTPSSNPCAIERTLWPTSRHALPVALLLILACSESHRHRSDVPDPDADSDSDSDSEVEDPCLEPDGDGDGEDSTRCGGDDCDDADPTIRPDARDVVGDGIDQSCDGVDGFDRDGDGSASEPSGGDDCDDSDPDVHPGAPDADVDGVDQDCDGIDGPDADGDGHADERVGGDDCDDSDPSIHPGAPDDAEWTAEHVPGEQGVSPTMALAPDGSVHIVHHGIAGVRHTWKEEDEWESESVYPLGGEASHRIDEAGVLHVAFVGLDGLRYATNASGEWESVVVDEGIGRVRHPSLAVGDDGVVHVSAGWQDGSHSELRYATNESGEWTAVMVDESDDWGGVGHWSSIGLDGDDSPQIAYGAERTTRLAARNDGEWNIEIVPGCEASNPLLLIDSGYLPHLLANGRGIEHFARAGGGWTMQHVTAGGVFAAALDDEDVLHVVRHDLVGPRLAYGTLEDDVFEEEIVEPAGEGGGYLSTQVGAGAVHIAFTADGLRYVRRELPDGIDQDCDGEAW